MRVDPEKHPARWHQHRLALRGVSIHDILTWANTRQDVRPVGDGTQLLNRDELAYLTRRLALGDTVQHALASVGMSNGPAGRQIAFKIQDALVKHDVILKPTQKYPILNSRLVEKILCGEYVPPVVRAKTRKGNTPSRYLVYYLIYLRQVKNLSKAQIQRLSRHQYPGRVLERYGLWENPDAHVSTSYAKGRAKHRKPVRIEWVHPSHLVEHQPLDRSTYRARVRHFTNVMVAKYGNLIDNADMLNEYGYVVDHKLSVRHGFCKDGRQVPWQMLCHPANLQVITAVENTRKGMGSDISPKELEQRIFQFNREHGTVLIPVDIEVLHAVKEKYRAMAKQRRRTS